ncbi:hypothetical protein PS631_02822 [Pseudomonas fluorescens]|uniref:Novel toxin 15 domain-containing protein n=1 Tax=Pseudomonas fluorescens TaxID=294 RepID=A0A5E6TMB6_PSEFL|nr:hypothetical protein PS631_02822 [Pseudomonas fluorescens]
MDNNWLATQQYVQARKELKEADGRIDELKVLAKWAYISKKQDLLTQSGVGQGLIKAGFDDISGLAQMLLHPIETVKAIGGLIDDPSALAGYPEEVKQNLKAKVARIEEALTVGGDEHAEQLGRDMGELVWDVGGLLTGVGGVAKGGVKLASVGIKLGRDSLEKMAVDGAKLVKTEGAGAGKVVPARPAVDVPEAPVTRVPDELAGTGKPSTSGGDPHVKPDAPIDPAKAVPLMDEFTVKPFNPYNSDKFKAMTPEQQKSFLKEYNKQLLAQEKAINQMSVDEFKIARDAYDKHGRNPDSVAAQTKFGKDFENDVRDSITESLMAKDKNLDFKTASAQASVRAKQIRSDLAALHDPDMVAGGWFSPEPVRMGDSLVNSSIGGSWPSRLKALDESVASAIANGAGQAKMNVRLELLRGAAK